MEEQDVRWIQRLAHYRQALKRLLDAQALASERPLSDLEEQGMIQAFEYTFELGWKVLKDFLESRGVQDIYGSRDVIRAAFERDLLDDGAVWMAMIASRNLTSHTYEEETAKQVLEAIREKYTSQFDALGQRLLALKDGGSQ